MWTSTLSKKRSYCYLFSSSQDSKEDEYDPINEDSDTSLAAELQTQDTLNTDDMQAIIENQNISDGGSEDGRRNKLLQQSLSTQRSQDSLGPGDEENVPTQIEVLNRSETHWTPIGLPNE